MKATHKTPHYAAPFSVRLTEDERKSLEQEAGHMSLGAYVRAKLFDIPSPRKRLFRRPVENEQILAQLLAELGRSNLANNLNQLAKANHSGSLPLISETEEALKQACTDIEIMRQCLIKALGLRI